MHGTFVNNIGMSSSSRNAIRQEFGNTVSYQYTTGNILPNAKIDRVIFAMGLYNYVLENRKPGEPITLVGHSHGGNVAIMTANLLEYHFKSKGENVNINLLTINTPSREYSLSENSAVAHYNVYSFEDIVQISGFADFDKYSNGFAGRSFENAFNIRYKDQASILSGCWFSGHCGQSDNNVNEWLPELTKLRNNVKEFRDKLRSLKINIE